MKGRLLVVLLLALMCGVDALATHFRYAHITYTAAGGNSVDFTYQAAWRRDGYGCIDPATNAFIPCSPGDGFPQTGDVIAEFVGGTVFNTGDGDFFGSPLGPLYFVVTSIDPLNNNLFGLAMDENSLPAIDTSLRHTYAAAGTFVAFVDSCCRISGLSPPNAHINNPDGGYRVETSVVVGGGNSSPVSALPPIVLCPINALCQFQVPGADPNGDPITYRLSTPAEASSFGDFNHPGPPEATNLAFITAGGQYNWDTNGATLGPVGFNTLYSTQVTIEDGIGKSAIDFLISLVPDVGDPPVFDTPPTPACGSTQVVTVGDTLTYTVQASDPDVGDIVTLNAAGVPFGATHLPPLPTVGNPVSSTFSWTPGAGDVGFYVITYTATDQTGQQALCSLTIEVRDEPARVTVERFEAKLVNNKVQLSADTNFEDGDFIGFNVYYQRSASDTLHKLNGAVIPASGNPAGAHYNLGEDATPGTVNIYTLEGLNQTGSNQYFKTTLIKGGHGSGNANASGTSGGPKNKK